MEKEEAKQWKSEPLLLSAKDLKRILRVNQNHIYELFHQESFPSIRIGKRFVIEKNIFREWLKQQSWKNEFISNYKSLTPEKQRLAEKMFWEAAEFLKDWEADSNDRTGNVTEFFG